MTVSTEVSAISYAGDDLSTVFTVPFRFLADADVQVRRRAADGSVTLLATGYSLSGAGSATGTCTFSTAPASGTDVIISRAPQILQPGDFTPNDRFPAETTELLHDRQTFISQYLRELIRHAISLPFGDAAVGAGVTLPAASSRADKYLHFDSNGAPEMAAVTEDGAVSPSLIGGLLYPQTAAEATAEITPTNYHDYDHPSRFGITCDGVTDDTDAWNALGSAPWASNIQIRMPAWANSKITDTITLPAPFITLYMEPGARITYAGTHDRAAIVLGADGESLTARQMRVSVQTSGNDYASADCVGVQLRGNVQSCHIHLDYAYGFTTNWQFLGTSTSGIGYNHVHLGASWDSMYHLDLHSAVANGWINENNFYGGQIQNSSAGYSNDDASYGIVFQAESGAYTGHNHNVFHKPCIQIQQTADSPTRVPIILKNCGSYNRFQSVRAEGLNGPVMRIESADVACVHNSLDLGYLAASIGTIGDLIEETEGGRSYGNIASIYGVPISQRFSSGDLLERAFAASSGNIGVLGMFFQTTGSATEVSVGAGKIGRDHVLLTSYALGTYVDTTHFKNFAVRADVLDSRGGRITITAYDGSGSQISTTRAVHGGGVTQSAAYGTAAYAQSADGVGRLVFRVNRAVKKIKLMFAPGTNACHIRSFELIAYGGRIENAPTHTANAYNQGGAMYGGPLAPIQRYATASPAALGGHYYRRGDVVNNGSAASGGATSAGWICTQSGWSPIAWPADTVVIVGQLVTNDSGKTYVCVTPGTTASSGGPTGTTAGITDGTAEWDYVASPATTQAAFTTLAASA